MTYEESVRYLYSLGRELASPRQASAMKFDLFNITVLCERMGHPEQGFESVHIAGTNGKGSTAAMLESILRTAGMRTGLYTSPHLERINERIRIGGKEISDGDFAAAFTRLHQLIEELLAAGLLAAHPTFFECVTALAFGYFAKAGVEFGVVVNFPPLAVEHGVLRLRDFPFADGRFLGGQFLVSSGRRLNGGGWLVIFGADHAAGEEQRADRGA